MPVDTTYINNVDRKNYAHDFGGAKPFGDGKPLVKLVPKKSICSKSQKRATQPAG